MSANRFFPPAVRLCQAHDVGTPAGGPAQEITRRSFLKRTGGATVATLVAWNLASKAEAMVINSVSFKPGDTVWYLFCAVDPSTDDMTFSGNAAGMYQTTNRDWSGQNAHDGKYPRRMFYYRKNTPFAGGDKAIILEIRAQGPVQCQRDSNGNPAPSERDLLGSIQIDHARITCGVWANPSNWFYYFESRMLYNDFNAPGSPTIPKPAGFCEYPLGAGNLKINRSTGVVEYIPGQVIPESAAGSYGAGVLWPNYRVQSLGVVQPRTLVQAVASVGDEANMKWKFDVDAKYKSVGIVVGMEWTNSAAVVERTMQWQIWKAYRTVRKDGTLGPIIPVGEAVPENNPPVEYVRPASLQKT